MILDIRWAVRARRDLEQLDNYDAAISPGIADDIGRKLIAAARFVAEHPKAGPVIGDGTRRKWIVRGSPYVLIYRSCPDHLRILRVRHVREDWHPVE